VWWLVGGGEGCGGLCEVVTAGATSGNLFVTLEGTPGALRVLRRLEALPEALECPQGSRSTLKCHKQVS